MGFASLFMEEEKIWFFEKAKKWVLDNASTCCVEFYQRVSILTATGSVANLYSWSKKKKENLNFKFNNTTWKGWEATAFTSKAVTDFSEYY